MRYQSLALVLTIPLFGLADVARGQEVDRFADGLVPGAYLRIGGGPMSPVNAQGTLRDWKPGTGVSVAWESWDNGLSGVSRMGFAISGAYSSLPLNMGRFLTEFVAPNGGSLVSLNASNAGVLEVVTNLIFRVPSPYIMPHFTIGLGFIDWRPGRIRYTSSSGSGTTKQQHLSGGEFQRALLARAIARIPSHEIMPVSELSSPKTTCQSSAGQLAVAPEWKL